MSQGILEIEWGRMTAYRNPEPSSRSLNCCDIERKRMKNHMSQDAKRSKVARAKINQIGGEDMQAPVATHMAFKGSHNP